MYRSHAVSKKHLPSVYDLRTPNGRCSDIFLSVLRHAGSQRQAHRLELDGTTQVSMQAAERRDWPTLSISAATRLVNRTAQGGQGR